jgi:hypothetical protein
MEVFILTDKIIFKLVYPDGRWEKYLLRKNGEIHLILSTGGFARRVMPDSLMGQLRLKQWTGKYYLNIDLLKQVTGIQYI